MDRQDHADGAGMVRVLAAEDAIVGLTRGVPGGVTR